MFWGYHAEQKEEFWCAWVKKRQGKISGFQTSQKIKKKKKKKD